MRTQRAKAFDAAAHINSAHKLLAMAYADLAVNPEVKTFRNLAFLAEIVNTLEALSKHLDAYLSDPTQYEDGSFG